MLHPLVKIFTILFFLTIFSSLALILYLLVAEETLVSQTVGSYSPQHDSNPTSPRIQPSSPQPEAQPHQGCIQLLLCQKLQPYQGLLKLLLN
jgi:hypothetical protein